MSFAKLPTQAPQFDANALTNALQKGPITPALAKQLIAWKRWVEATSEADGSGLRDVVSANAQALNAVKADLDGHSAKISKLMQDVASLETRPTLPFPVSG